MDFTKDFFNLVLDFGDEGSVASIELKPALMDTKGHCFPFPYNNLQASGI
jgi:hypothetical protein